LPKILRIGIPADIVLTGASVPDEAGVADAVSLLSPVAGVGVVAHGQSGPFTTSISAHCDISGIAAAVVRTTTFLEAGDVGNDGRGPVAVRIVIPRIIQFLAGDNPIILILIILLSHRVVDKTSAIACNESG